MDNLVFSINAVAPVFLIILLGSVLKKINIIDDVFVSRSSRLVFKLALPVLIFMQLSVTDFSESFSRDELLLILAGIGFSFLFSWALSVFMVKKPEKKGPFIQGSFRGNFAILGLAVVLNVFGETGFAKGAILLAFLMPLFNILAVIALTVPMHGGKEGAYRKIFINLLTNPIIISVIISLPFSIFRIRLPEFLMSSLSYVSRMTLPLALLGIGGSLSFGYVRDNLLYSITSSVIKTVLTPLFTVALAMAVGISGVSLGLVFLVSSCPAAISSFVMADAMGNDSRLAASIILISTLFSVFVMAAGLFLLKSYSLI